MEGKYDLIDRFLAGKTTNAESVQALSAIAADPGLEEYVVTQKRFLYEEQQQEAFGSFIPARNMAADDGNNLCDFQCELFILQQEGIVVPEEVLAEQSKKNYWLRNQGTPLYHVGRLLGSKELADNTNTNGFLVSRVYDANWNELVASVVGHYVIAVVNGEILEPKGLNNHKIVSLKDDANHAVVVLSVSTDNDTITLFNPVNGQKETVYGIQAFKDAWAESKNYMVSVRRRKFREEYIPQPIDVSMISLEADLEELTEMIAENAHDIWAIQRMEKGWTYGKERDDKMKKNPDMVPYDQLSEPEKDYDRKMAIGTLKLVKRLGYRIVNISGMYKCPDCGEIIEPGFNFCPSCGRQLTWEDFR